MKTPPRSPSPPLPAGTEDPFRNLINAVDIPVILLDANRAVRWMTASAEEAFRLTRADLGRSAQSLNAAFPRDLDPAISAVMGTRAPQTREFQDETGRWFKMRISAHTTPDGVVDGALLAFRDIQAAKELHSMSETWNKAFEDFAQRQSILNRNEKLEAIGRLAGGVAHDFNNLLTGILGMTHDCLDNLPADDPKRRNLEDVIEAADKASNLTRQLLAFGRRQMVNPRILDVNPLILSLKELSGRILGEGVELKWVLDPLLGNIKADQENMEQAVLTLVLNAGDAMPDGGTLTVETANVNLADQEAESREIAPGPCVAITVSDTGSGMGPEAMAHVFEPFFTAKEDGKASGLGLATVYGIVKQNGGDISVERGPGKGTTFRITFPRVEKPPFVDRRGSGRGGAAAGGNETILLTEDEGIVRKTVTMTLRKRGYKVLEAADAEEAVALSGKHPGPIDLLLTDVVMPGRNGRQLAAFLAERRPAMKIIYMSGYNEDIIAQRGILEPGVSFIEKSFTAETLCRKVRQVLDAPPTHQLPLFPAS